MNAGRGLVVLAALALAAAAARDARAQAPSDLTGTWVGSVSCNATVADDGSKAKSSERNLTLLIHRVADGPNGAEYAANFQVLQNFSARSIDVGGLGSGKGVLTLADCGDDDDAATGATEVTRLKFSVNAAKGTGKLSGQAFFNQTDGDPEGGGSGTCKLSFKRIDMIDPNDVNGCD
jgi:hypothetical protein